MAIIPMADVIDRQLLPIDAQDVVTKVRLVVAGNRAGAAPVTLTARTRTRQSITYAPKPVTIEYEAPEHAVYGATRSFALPTGVDPFLLPTDPLIPDPASFGFDNPGSPSVVRDGDPTTYAEFNPALGPGPDGDYALWYSFNSNTPEETELYSRLAGFRLVTTMSSGATVDADAMPPAFAFARVDAGWSAANDWISARARYALTPSDDPAEAYALLPATTSDLWISQGSPSSGSMEAWLIVRGDANVDWLRVTHFYPLVLNMPLLLDIARRQIRLPAANPQRITVRGYVPPDREHTITGWPGGDYTGVVAQHQYDLGKTIIDFEQAGAPTGLPAEAMEAARERRQAIDGTVAVANYNLKMGFRG